MNREIEKNTLFRGKVLNLSPEEAKEFGEWEYGFYVFCRRHHYILPTDVNGFDERYIEWVEVDPGTVGEYVGYDPVHGRLFDGDIFIPLGVEVKMQIFWQQEKLRWACMAIGIGYVDALSDHIDHGISKVIGNIYDNPELRGER